MIEVQVIADDDASALEEVDEEIAVIAGCALGFVSQNSPPHVLHVEADSILEQNGVQTDDVLWKVNGRDVGNPFLGKQKILELIGETPDRVLLTFLKPSAAPKFIANYTKEHSDQEALGDSDTEGTKDERGSMKSVGSPVNSPKLKGLPFNTGLVFGAGAGGIQLNAGLPLGMPLGMPLGANAFPGVVQQGLHFGNPVNVGGNGGGIQLTPGPGASPGVGKKRVELRSRSRSRKDREREERRALKGPFDEDSEDERANRGLRDRWTRKEGESINHLQQSFSFGGHSLGAALNLQPGQIGHTLQPGQIGHTLIGQPIQPGSIPPGAQILHSSGHPMQFHAQRPGQSMQFCAQQGTNLVNGNPGVLPAHMQMGGGGAPMVQTSTVLLENVPGNMQNVGSVAATLGEFGEIKNFRVLLNGNVAASFATEEAAEQAINAVNATGLGGVSTVRARYYEDRKGKGKKGSHKGSSKGGKLNGHSLSRSNFGGKDGSRSGPYTQKGGKMTPTKFAEGNVIFESEHMKKKQSSGEDFKKKQQTMIQHVTERMQQVMGLLTKPGLKESQKGKLHKMLSTFKKTLTELTESGKEKSASTSYDDGYRSKEAWSPEKVEAVPSLDEFQSEEGVLKQPAQLKVHFKELDAFEDEDYTKNPQLTAPIVLSTLSFGKLQEAIDTATSEPHLLSAEWVAREHLAPTHDKFIHYYGEIGSQTSTQRLSGPGFITILTQWSSYEAAKAAFEKAKSDQAAGQDVDFFCTWVSHPMDAAMEKIEKSKAAEASWNEWYAPSWNVFDAAKGSSPDIKGSWNTWTRSVSKEEPNSLVKTEPGRSPPTQTSSDEKKPTPSSSEEKASDEQ